jgi:hypothetical protein
MNEALTNQQAAPIVKAEPSGELQNFGGRDPIKEMALRIRTMLPNATHYSNDEAMAIAQLAFAHDLDPFNGDVWGIGTGGSWKGIMVGVKGLRKAAKREASAENGTYWFDVPALVPAKDYNCDKPGAIAYKMVLRDSVTTQAWAKSVHELTSAGIPYAEAVKLMGGQPPCTIGIGIADPGEPSKMALHARAKKRGESECLKIRYSIEFRGASVTVEDAPELPIGATPASDFAEAEFTDIADDNQETPEQREEIKPARAERQILDELGFDDQPAPVSQSAPIALSTQQARHSALFARVQKAGILNQTTLEVWKRRGNDNAEIIAEKCDLMEIALSATGAI